MSEDFRVILILVGQLLVGIVLYSWGHHNGWVAHRRLVNKYRRLDWEFYQKTGDLSIFDPSNSAGT